MMGQSQLVFVRMFEVRRVCKFEEEKFSWRGRRLLLYYSSSLIRRYASAGHRHILLTSDTRRTCVFDMLIDASSMFR